MKVKIIFLMVCWLSIASCYGEWSLNYTLSSGYPSGNTYLCTSRGDMRCFPPAGKYIAGARFIPLSGPKSGGVCFLNNNWNWRDPNNPAPIIYEKFYDTVEYNVLYTIMCPVPAAEAQLLNYNWSGATPAYVELDIRDYVAEMPIIDPPGGIVPPGQDVTITSSQSYDGAVIYYTVDGTEPTVNGKPYADGIITLDDDTTVKAVAYYKGLVSPINTKTFQIGYLPPKIDPPGGTFNNGTSIDVTITNAPENNGLGIVQFRRNDNGTAAESSWGNYTSPLEITSSAVIEARVVAGGGESGKTSDVAKETYEFVVAQVESPDIQPPGGNMPSSDITMSCATPGADIYYAINSAPSRTSSKYDKPFALEITVPAVRGLWDEHKPATEDQFSVSCRVSAFAIKTGWKDSSSTSRVYVTGDSLPQATAVTKDDTHTNVNPDGSVTSGGKTYTLPDYGDYTATRGDLLDQYNAATTPDAQQSTADQIYNLDLTYYGDVNSYYYAYQNGGSGGGGGTTGGGGTGGGNDNPGSGTTTGNAGSMASTGVVSTAVQSGDSSTGSLLFLGGTAAGTALLPSLLESGDGKVPPPEDSKNEAVPDSYSRKVYFTK